MLINIKRLVIELHGYTQVYYKLMSIGGLERETLSSCKFRQKALLNTTLPKNERIQ